MNKRELNRATEKIMKESKQHRLFSDCQSRMKKSLSRLSVNPRILR